MGIQNYYGNLKEKILKDHKKRGTNQGNRQPTSNA